MTAARLSLGGPAPAAGSCRRAAIVVGLASSSTTWSSWSTLACHRPDACEPGRRRSPLQQTVNALSIGAIYALIALGYTMVYGIIELINFAHGDVFMIGAFVVACCRSSRASLGLRAGRGSTTRLARCSSLIVAALVVTMTAHRAAQPGHRAGVLPAAAQRAAARAADHRDRRLVHPAEHRAGRGRQRRPRVAPDLPGRLGVPDRRRADRGADIVILVIALRADGRAAAVRVAHAAGPRDALDRAGPRGVAADGRRRQPDDRPDVPPGRRPGRRGRRRLGPLLRHSSGRTSASTPASRRSPPPSSAASATSPAPWSAAS